MKGSLAERFEAKVQRITECGCWIWTGAVNNRGYGQLYDGSKVCLAHRLSYEMHVAKIPANGNVLHRCDVPACVNPAHLFTGTHADNMRDMAHKHRGKTGWTVRGNDVVFSKLTAELVREIRTKYAAGNSTQRQLAREYGVTQAAIGYITRRDVWKHI